MQLQVAEGESARAAAHVREGERVLRQDARALEKFIRTLVSCRPVLTQEVSSSCFGTELAADITLY